MKTIIWYIMSSIFFQYVIKAPKTGQISKVLFQPGDNVRKNASLVQFAEDE